MVTKTQALEHNLFIDASGNRWRRNGRTKTYKSARNAHRYRVPIKHGLFAYGYIDENNAHEYSVFMDDR